MNSTPIYPDNNALFQIQKKLESRPHLIARTQVELLHEQLTQAFYGGKFIIQAGDCAERFADAEKNVTHQKYEQLISFKSLIESILKLPAIAIGRLAGQYAKPRSIKMEMIQGKLAYPYHGDLINTEQATDLRSPDPNRLLQAYDASKKILSDLVTQQEFIFTSHECFLLEYEQPLSRFEHAYYYNTGAHFLWLGMRNIESKKHIQYLSSIANPIGIKVGHHTPLPALLSAMCSINPENIPGKITLITRLGYKNTSDRLTALIHLIQKHQLNVLWMCDPLHGNTQIDCYGKKFRLIDHAIQETLSTVDLLKKHSAHLSGLHLETSPKTNILECVSARDQLTCDRTYDSAVDPRLNKTQSLAYLNTVLKYMANSHDNTSIIS